MNDLVSVLEKFLQESIDGTNFTPETDESNSHIEFDIVGLSYQQDSLRISNLYQDDYDEETVEFEVILNADFDISFEGEDYSEASYDKEDDEWYNTETVSEKHIYRKQLNLNVELNLALESFEITTPQNEVHIDVNINDYLGKE